MKTKQPDNFIPSRRVAGAALQRPGLLQRAAVNSAAPVPAVPPAVHDMLRSPGRPLDAATRAFMEPRFAHDFSGVRVHTDDRAASSARAVQAQAYTVGRDVVFGAGQYAPGTSHGQRLLAHELTHVAQQRAGGSGDLTVGPPASAEEREADAAAWRVSGGDSLGAPVRPMPYRIQRKVFTAEELKAMDAAHKPRDPMATMGLLPSAEGFKTYTARDLIPPTEVKVPKKDPPAKDAPKKDAPADKVPTPPVKPATPAKEPAEADDKPGVALQLGRGRQGTPISKDPRVQNDPDVNYVQATVMLHDAYLVEGKSLAPWLKNFSFLGEPGAQLQLHLSGAAVGSVDAQVLFNVVQASLEVWKHKLDLSLVAGGMVSDLKAFKSKDVGKRVTPIPTGVDAELGLVKISPSLKITLDVQGLVGLPYLDAAGGKAAGRKAVVQGSAELRLVVEF